MYAEYAKTSNLVAVAIYGLMLIGGQTAQIGKEKTPLFRDFFVSEDADVLQQVAVSGSRNGPKSTAVKATTHRLASTLVSISPSVSDPQLLSLCRR